MEVPPRPGGVIVSSDEDDDVPIMQKMTQPSKPVAKAEPPVKSNGTSAIPAPVAKPVIADIESDDDKPLAARKATIAPSASKKAFLDNAEELPTAPKPKAAPKPVPPTNNKKDVSSDSDDDIPLAKRVPISPSAISPAAAPTMKKDKPKIKPEKKKIKEEKKRPQRDSETPSRTPSKRSRQSETSAEIRWNTLEHAGVMFPPEYEPHGVKMLYDGVPVDLTPEQEEVATFFAVMKETDYMNKQTFLNNFWEGFRDVLGSKHTIQTLEKCDFTPIFEYHMAERERKRNLPKEEKERLKREKEAVEAPYKYAIIDGKKEQVGNFRIEPPGLFRGRGEHPKMGKLKKRIHPRDVTINIGKGAPVPTHPFPGQNWKEVRHDNTVTWLAYWKDPVNTKEYKYVFLAANSSWKSESDLQKYEKARKLKLYIEDIRATYKKNWEAKERREKQMATALYFIDRLALRAGHEKDDDEADTVGCCTLKCENVECIEPHTIKFDFLGKDSIRYENMVEVEELVFKNIKMFKAKDGAGRPKNPDDQLFDEFDAQDLNTRLKDLMEGLSVKVFRTYNASITLDRLLREQSQEETVEGRKAEYDRANKEVAILCNHQRAVPKAHTSQMEKLQEKLTGMQDELKELEDDLKKAKAGKPNKDGKKLSEETVRGRLERKRAQIVKAEIAAQNKEELKTVALGTSKINYLDPRITVAWCKRNEVPMEKVFNRSLLSKFFWAMDVEPEFVF